MTVVALHRPPEPAPKPPPVDTHAVLPAAARNAMTELVAAVSRMDRTFRGPSAAVTAVEKIPNEVEEIITLAKRVARFCR